MLRLELLGSPRLVVAGRLAAMPSRLPSALLWALALEPAGMSRERLIGLFWPERPPAVAQHNLRVNLHRARQWLAAEGAPGAMQGREDHLRLAADTDVAELRTAWARRDAAAVLALYRGPLLDSRVVGDFDPFAAAVEVERQHLAGLRHDALLAHAAALAAADQPEVAAQALDEYLHQQPLAEDVLRALLRLAPAAGQQAQALRLYERFCRRVAEELDAAPEPATRDLAAALQRGPMPASARGQSIEACRLVGRAQEQRWLLSGGGAWRLIVGEPGSGKTRLVRDVLGPEVVWLSCRDSTREQVLAPVVDWLTRAPPALLADLRPADRRELARWCPAMLPGESLPPARASASPRVLALLAELLAAPAQTIVVDDLQWADSATLAVLRLLLAQRSAQLVATLRSSEVTEALSLWLCALQDEGRLLRCELAALPPEAMSELLVAANVEGPGSMPLARWLHRRSGGNPYFALDTLRGLAAGPWLSRLGLGRWQVAAWPAEVAAPRISERAGETVRRRVQALTEPARRVLALAAVAGDAHDLALLAAAADLSRWKVGAAVTEAQRSGLLDGERFAHDLVREAVAQQLGAAERQALHAGLAERAGALWPPERVAGHWWAAGDAGRAVQATLAACVRDRGHGLHAQAAERAERALARTEVPTLRAALATELARTAFDIGDPARVRHWLAQVHVQLPDPRTRALALVTEADLALLEGRIADAEALLAEGELCAPDVPELEILRTVIAHQRGDQAAASASAAKRVARERRRVPSPALAEALTNLGAAFDAGGNFDRGLRHHREAWQLAGRLGARHLQVRVAVNLVESLRNLGRVDEAIAMAEQALALGPYEGSAAIVNNLAAVMLQLGRLEEAAAHSRSLLDDRDPTLRCLACARLLRIAARRGADGEITAWAERTLREMACTDVYLARAAAIASLLDHGPAALRAAALAYVKDEPLPPSVQGWLDRALERHRAGTASGCEV